MNQSRPGLYALLIGVGAYDRIRPLHGPVGDVQKLEQYLRQSTIDHTLNLLVLTDRQASKTAIIDAFRTHLAQAGPGDTVLVYFSGHGTQEDADPTLWPTETDGKLECIVCYDADTTAPHEFLLADKELRYLIGQLAPTGAHIVTIFDCCHAGDNTRNADLLMGALAGQDVRERRLAQTAPRRPYDAFCFHDSLSAEQLREQGIAVALPPGDYLQLAACESDESAVEVDGEGIFTRYLLRVLDAAHGQLSYGELHSRVRQYMRFGYEQRPRLYTPDSAAYLIKRGFLNQPLEPFTLTAAASYNPQEGWLLDVGAIHGIGQTWLMIWLYLPDTRKIAVTVDRFGADYAVLSIAYDHRARLDKSLTYRVSVSGLLYRPVRLHIINHGGPASDLPALLTQTADMTLDICFVVEDNEANANFTLHARNGLLYLTHPATTNSNNANRPLYLTPPDTTDSDNANRPLIRPIPLDEPQLAERLLADLRHLSQWNYLTTLSNLAAGKSPLTVDLTGSDGSTRTLIGENPAPVDVLFTGQNNRWTASLAIRLTNPTDQPLYCTALYLSRDFMSFTDFLPTNYRLEPGAEVWLGLADKKAPTGRQTAFRLTLEDVIRQYNWPFATERIKLLVTTDPLSEKTLDFLRLDALPSPPTLADRFTTDRGGIQIDTDEVDPLPDWSTQTITLRLLNPLYNTVRPDELSQLLTAPDDLADADLMADFMLGLYYEPDPAAGLQTALRLRPDLRVLSPTDEQRGLWTDLTLGLANGVAKRVQNRQYRQNLVRYPDRLRIVAEGDSWFQYPFRLRDIIDYLSGVYSVYSVAAAGATLADYLKDSTFLEAIGQVKPAFFLLSGGGNDLLGDAFAGFVRDAPTTDEAERSPVRYLTDAFAPALTAVIDRYRRILRLVQLGYPQLRVLIHGYDYVIPAGHDNRPGHLVWMGTVLTQHGITDPAERDALIHYILDQFNEQLRQVAGEFTNVTYLDLRGTVRRSDQLADYWYDEIHPNDKGFLSLSARFVEQINQLANPSPAASAPAVPDHWDDDFLWHKRTLGDPLADGVIETLLATNQKGEVDQIFQLLVRNRQFPNPAFDALPDPVKQVVENYFVQTRQLPDWAEPFKLRIAADMFRQHGSKILLILLCKSLPLCYTCWRGAKVLYQTGRLRVHDGSLNAFSRRLMETAQFVVDVLTPDNFEADGTAIVAAQKVRLMHSCIRYFARQRQWDEATYGVPINQEDLAGTLMSFGIVILDGLGQLGITLTPDERASYLHLWRVTGHLMGLDADLLPDDEAACRGLMDAILAQQSGPSMEGADLTDAVIDLMNDRLIAGPLKRLSPYFIRFFVGDTYADMLRVPPADGQHSLIMEAVRWTDQRIRSLDNQQLILAALGRSVSSGLVTQMLRYSNAAKRDQFYLPSALADGWQDLTPDFRIPPLDRIGDVIFYLDKVAQHFKAQNNPMGLFTAVYLVVTQRVAEGLAKGLFENPAGLEQLDVGFGNRYFEALNHYFDGKPATGPWQTSFDAAQHTLLADQHIFVAANAHISFDLPIVLAEQFRGRDLQLIQRDFAVMNQLFDDMFDQMNDDIGRIFRPMGRVLHLIEVRFKALERRLIRQGREQAWTDCTDLHQLDDPDQWQHRLDKLERDSVVMGRQIVDPPAVLQAPLKRIADSEFGTPAQKIDVMLRTALLPSVQSVPPLIH